MPRSRNRVPRPPAEPAASPPSDLDEWGSDPAEIGLEEDLGAPPAPPAPPAEQPRPPPARLLELGPPPEDTVAAAKWAYQAQMILAYEAMTDEGLSPAARRKEARTAFAGAAKHMSDALRFDVLKIINQEKEQLDVKKRGRASAKLAPAPAAPESAKVIPFRNG